MITLTPKNKVNHHLNILGNLF